MVGEHGAEWVDTRHVHLRGLADELGIGLVDRSLPGEAEEEDGRIWVDGGWAASDGVLGGLRELEHELTRLARSNGSFFAGEASASAIAFDEMSAAEWITLTTGEPVGSRMGRVITQRTAGWYGLDPEALGASNLLDLFVVRFPGDDVRFTVDGGADRIPTAMAAALPGGTITLEAPLTSVRRGADGSFEVRFDEVPSPVLADHLILAVPFSTLREVDLTEARLSGLKRRAIGELAMGTNAKLMIAIERSFEELDQDWEGSLQRADDPICFAWGSASVRRDGRTAALLTVFTGGRTVASYHVEEAHAPAPMTAVDATLASFDEMLPGIRGTFSGEAWLDVWEADPWARGSYPAFGPGQMTSFLGRLGQPEGRLHFAGDHTSLYSHGYMDGAVESGGRAAAEVLDAMGVRRPRGLALAEQRRKSYEPVYPWS